MKECTVSDMVTKLMALSSQIDLSSFLWEWSQPPSPPPPYKKKIYKKNTLQLISRMCMAQSII